MADNIVYEFSNDYLTVKVNSIGAELRSVTNADGKEYLHNADPKYWHRTAPVLFPSIGKMKNNEYEYNGFKYPMSQHGFARDKEFKLIDKTDSSMTFALEDDNDTFKIYPFHFKFEIGYVLEKNTIKVIWKLHNKSEDTMYYALGGHPAFLCPLEADEDRFKYFIKFQNNNSIVSSRLDSNGLINEEKEEFKLDEGYLKVTEHLFDKDALVLENNQVHSISLVRPDKTEYVKVVFDTPVVGVWSPAKAGVPFVCIEPWYGIADASDFSGTLKDRAWGNELEAGKDKEYSWNITIK